MHSAAPLYCSLAIWTRPSQNYTKADFELLNLVALGKGHAVDSTHDSTVLTIWILWYFKVIQSADVYHDQRPVQNSNPPTLFQCPQFTPYEPPLAYTTSRFYLELFQGSPKLTKE